MNVIMTLSLVFFMSCSDDDSIQSDTINGVWNLKNISGEFTGIDIDYNQGDVTWDFNLENNTLIVENNIITNGPEDIYAGLDSGTYEIRIENGEGIETLFIDDIDRGQLILLGTNLKIDEGLVSDGFLTEFER